jgi:NAD(P)-dependent dehydrogenase (short-subunit alcohol dehydrogenase family)
MAVALVTGTSTGIGLATAVAFARAGHDVYATMRHPDRAPELASTAAKDTLPIKILPMDVYDDASVVKATAQLLAGGGRIDVLVNNAGIDLKGPIEELPLAEFRRVMETNYFGALRCIQAVVPGMRARRSGHVINVTSIAGRVSVASQAPYAASKWALEAASEALAQEVKSFGIHVSIVEPGVIATPIFDKRREVPANTRYPQERRLNAFFNASLKQPISPLLVADKIVEIVESKTWKLRHPLGPDAEPFLAFRASMTDEQWVDLHSIESDQEWAAVLKRDIGLDVVLPSEPEPA